MEGPEEPRGGHNPPGCAWWAWLAPVGCAHLKAHLRVKPMLKNPINRETIRNNPRSEVLPPQASVATKNQSRPRFGTLPKGEIIIGGHLHHPGDHHDEEGVVLPRGWGFVPVAMCLISLSLSCSWDVTILMYHGFVNTVGSYGVSPSLSFCDELSFPFEISFYRIEYFYGFESTWYRSCIWILVVTMGYRIGSLDICFGTQLADSRGDIGVIYA